MTARLPIAIIWLLCAAVAILFYAVMLPLWLPGAIKYVWRRMRYDERENHD